MERFTPEPRSARVLRLTSGTELVDRWSADVGQVERNAVHEALFAVAERRVADDCMVLPGATDHPEEFYVLLAGDLAVGVRLEAPNGFGVTYVGPMSAAPTLDIWADVAA